MAYTPETMRTLLDAVLHRERKLTDGELVDVAMAIDSGSVAHLKEPQLLEIAAIVQELSEPFPLKLAAGMIDSVKLPPKETHLEQLRHIVVRWADHALEVLQATGFGFSTQMITTRSAMSTTAANVFTFAPAAKHDFTPTLRIAKRSGKRFDLFVDELPLPLATRCPRITLRRGDKEVSSLHWNGDSIRFANIGIGSYSVEIDPRPTDWGTVSVTLTDSEATP
ncbi:MAG: hypothetical protein HUU55_01930 [Myxococcales bacterium]|nr:hypothetical protein [Myxococcales bacterium]